MTNKIQKAKPQPLALGIINPTAAGLDVGSMNMFVSYVGAQGEQIVKEYDAFTENLYQLARDLKEAGVTHLAMEATGVYWMSVYEVLEDQGIDVTLINARHYKNVTAQKTDVLDCQWLQQLHAHGLLRRSHISESSYRELRTYVHERKLLQNAKADTLNRIQKVLTQMNIKLQHVISDLEGITGMKLLEKLAAGIDNPEDLLEGVNIKQLKHSKETLIKSLQGMVKTHHRVVLKNHLVAYRFYKEQMLNYEVLIEEVLNRMLPPDSSERNCVVEKKRTKARKNQYHFNLKGYLSNIVGVDLCQVDGLDEIAVLTIISVVGLNMQKWPTAEHFTSWLNLAARPKKSGGKLLGHQKRFTGNTATQAFRMAAQTMWQSKSPLGNLYRRLSTRKGSRVAIKAVARRLAVIVYNMIKNQTHYDAKATVMDEDKIRSQKIKYLQKQAEKLGCRVEVAV